jgi:universal stress protein A
MKAQSVASKRARIPVSVAEKTDGQRPIAIKKILVPTDFSPASRKSFCYALRFAKGLGSKITLLHVVEPATSFNMAGLPPEPVGVVEKEFADAETGLHELVDEAEAAGVSDAKSMLRAGVATHEIVEAAKDLDVDLIVIATHGYTGWKYFAIGSTAERVARAAPCPVLVVREKEHDFL